MVFVLVSIIGVSIGVSLCSGAGLNPRYGVGVPLGTAAGAKPAIFFVW